MNKLKGIILVCFIACASIMMPFNIYADTAIVMGTDVSLIDSSLLKSEQYTSSSGTITANNVLYTYKVTVQLDNNYVGYLLLKLDYSYYNNPQSGFRVDSSSATRRVFINGNKAEFNFTIDTWYSSDPLLRNTTNGTPNAIIQEQGVTLLSELDSIQQIIDILNDLYNSQDQIEGLLNNQLDQLELVVSNTSLANQYLDTLSKLRQYNFPLESWFVNYPFLVQRTSKTFQSIYYWNYPVYDVVTNTELCTGYNTKGNKTIYIFGTSSNIGSSNFNNYFSYTSNVNATFEEIPLARYSNYKFFKVTFNHLEHGTFRFTAISNVDNLIHIYLSDSRSSVSTDFALLWGLSNQLLDDLHTIANGTTASNNASQQLESDTSDFAADRDDLIDIEDSMGNDMDSAMNQITPNNNGLSGFGGNFLTSAVWVRTQFERLTNNTPYGSLIVYGMTLGIALLLLGKVML